MFSFTDVIYYILFTTALILSFMAAKENFRGLNYLRILLVVGLVSELIVDAMDHFTEYPNLFYYIYIPFEFIILSLFFKKSTDNKLLKTVILYSISAYSVIVIGIISYHSVSDYPGIIYNIGCTFILIWAVTMLFTFEVKNGLTLIKLPFFWICTGLIILYSGVFFYNSVYNYLLEEQTDLAKRLRILVNLNLNYLFYIIWSYAFICSIRLKKYSIQ